MDAASTSFAGVAHGHRKYAAGVHADAGGGYASEMDERLLLTRQISSTYLIAPRRRPHFAYRTAQLNMNA